MEPRASTQFRRYIESVRDDIVDCSQQLNSKQQEIAAALQQSEELAIDAATLKVRMKELELDEELVKQSEDAAVNERVLAEKRLMEVGGYERAVRVLQKALQDAKQELQDTKDEKALIMSEEKKLHQELVQLHTILHKRRDAGVKLQHEYTNAIKSKREIDEKLARLSLFLQTTIDSTTTSGSPRSSPTKAEQMRGPLASDAALVVTPFAAKEASLSPPSPLPSPRSIRSQLAKWSTSAVRKTSSSNSNSASPTRTQSTSSLSSSVEPSPSAGE